MAIQSILRPKRVIDVMPVSADFTPYLVSGETVTDAGIQVFTFSGNDLSPVSLLYGNLSIDGGRVSQRIQAGIAGVVYVLKFSVTTSLDREIDWWMKLQVLPEGVPAENIYVPFFLSSTPYPIFTEDGIDQASNMISAVEWMPPADDLDLVADITWGELRSILITYSNWPDEGIDVASDIIDGELRAILISYTDWPPEGIDMASDILTGILKQILISYTNWTPEGIDLTSDIVSGTLV